MKIKNIIYLLNALVIIPIYAQFTEYDVKAQFMERFTQYIEWPKGAAIYNQEIPFRIGIYGENNFEYKLNEMVQFVKIKNKKIKYKELNSDLLLDCDLIFISKCSDEELSKIISLTKGKGILLISDSDGFGEKGVHINFYKVDNKIHFEINLSAVKSDLFNFSSRLLRLARIIE
ncbi:MAG: YfiR family protein [Bacteroidetes bacterium]|nr:YfiR family protein [Bacteroidota bacterium]MBU1113571.1 YfiR family protein [Bacteroidota bacterium]MBU1798627.1 YfiR family protein [Bacteroidota bacterium]